MSRMLDYYSRKISGQCVVYGCNERQHETIRCERHQDAKRREQKRYRERQKHGRPARNSLVDSL
jgi:hypothetical protein